MNQKSKAFTLVELIVVITILAILGTIAFISLEGYSQSARDSVRISDLSNISKGLELQLTKGGKVSIPDDKVDITASGTVISYQGYVGEQVLQNIGVHGGGKDPIDDNYYTYTTNTSLSKYQIMGFLENELEISLLNNTFSLDYSTRYPIVRGGQLGILLSSGSLVPVQETGNGVDIVNTNNNYRAYLNNESSEIVSGTGVNLQIGLSYRINEKGSCNSILRNGNSKGDGIYSINPTGTGSFDVYCDMTTDGGGWTRVVDYNGNALYSSINSSDWYQDKDNYIYLYSLRSNKNSRLKYEFKLEAYKGVEKRVIHFVQNNSYRENPDQNNFQELGGNFEFEYLNSNWYGLATGNYGNLGMQGACTLAMSYGSTSNTNWRTCVIDKNNGSFGTGPLLTTLQITDRIIIWQK